MDKIQLFKPEFRIDECLTHIRECLERGWTGMGFKTVEFENAWNEYTGMSHSHFLNSATSGLHLAIKLFKDHYQWDENTEIISTPMTFVSTNHAVKYEGLKVVFADVDQYLCLDPKSVEERITPNTKALIFVGLGGSAGQYEKIVEICKKYNLKLILDAAHMAGTRLHGKIVGKDADVVIYSFQAVKNLPTADSGMICFREKQFDDAARKWTWLGISQDTFARSSSSGAYKWRYDVDHVGYKYHGNSVMASLGLVGLKYLDQDNQYRRTLRGWYEELLKDIKGIQFIPVPPGCESSTHICQIVVENRDELLVKLNENGVYPGVHYRDNTEYKVYDYAKGTCPKAAYYSDRVLSLPLHMQLERHHVEHIATVLKNNLA